MTAAYHTKVRGKVTVEGGTMIRITDDSHMTTLEFDDEVMGWAVYAAVRNVIENLRRESYVPSRPVLLRPSGLPENDQDGSDARGGAASLLRPGDE